MMISLNCRLVGRLTEPRVPGRFQGRGFPASAGALPSGAPRSRPSRPSTYPRSRPNRPARAPERGPGSIPERRPPANKPLKPFPGQKPPGSAKPFGRRLPKSMIGWKLNNFVRFSGPAALVRWGITRVLANYFANQTAHIAMIQSQWNLEPVEKWCYSTCNGDWDVISTLAYDVPSNQPSPCRGVGTGCISGQAVSPASKITTSIGYWRRYPISGGNYRHEHHASFRFKPGYRYEKTPQEATRLLQKPRPRYVPSPAVEPAPWLDPLVPPGVMPLPVPPPHRIVPGRSREETKRGVEFTNSGPAPGVTPRTEPTPLPQPALARQREEKRYVAAAARNALFAALENVFHGLTEFGDFADAFHDALPKQYQAKQKGLYAKIEALYRHIDKVDLADAMKNIFVNEIEDQAIGALMKKADQAGIGVSLSGRPYIKNKRKFK